MPLRNLIIIAVALLVSLACYSVAAKNRYANLFAEVMNLIDQEALRPVAPEKLFTSAMDGMMAELDDHSAFIAGERFRKFDEDLKQEFGGVGMYVETNPITKRLFILAPLPDTPAFKAGLQIGDEIIEIDGQNVIGEDRTAAVKLLRGPVNQAVTVTVDRHGELLTKKIKRAAISVPSVSGDFRLPNGNWKYVLNEHPQLGYIRLSQFGEKSADEMEVVLNEITPNIDGLILDFRNNPGGLLDVAIEICDFFLPPKQVIVSTRGRNGKLSRPPVLSQTEPLVRPNLPIVILVNRYSASASEIVAGCLQDHNRAVIIGEQSYGKGTVQNVIPMQRGTSALKLTTASYWRPSGKHIDRHDDIAVETKTWGVQPDENYEIELSESDVFDELRYRSLRDLEGLITDENSEAFAAIKRMRMTISQPDVTDTEPQLETPKPDEPDSVEPSENNADGATEPEENPTDPANDTLPFDRTIERAIEYFEQAVAPKIAA